VSRIRINRQENVKQRFFEVGVDERTRSITLISECFSQVLGFWRRDDCKIVIAVKNETGPFHDICNIKLRSIENIKRDMVEYTAKGKSTRKKMNNDKTGLLEKFTDYILQKKVTGQFV